jgi:UMF1 family MFS transporter
MSSGTSGAISIESAKIAFVIVALWWLGFSFPILKNVSQVHFIEPVAHPIKDSFIRLLKTFREIQKYKNALLFLIAYFFYIDGVDTIITMATAYGRDIGLGITMLILVVLMIQVVAFPFALVYGKLAKKYSTKAMLFAGIGIYTLITLISFFLPALPTMQMKVLVFWVLAFLVATSQGGIQALSRSYFGKLIPAEHAGEFFGFYNIFGKFAAITGPFLVGLITRVTGHSRFGILSIIVLFIIGGIFLIKVDREP